MQNVKSGNEHFALHIRHYAGAIALVFLALHVPYPPASLEQHYLPSVERIAEAVRRTVKY